MRTPSDAAIDAEHKALDAITVFLEKPENRRGRTTREIADATGIAIGRIEAVCNASEIVLKRRCHNKKLWWNDWSDLQDCERFAPKRKRGRPAKIVAAA